MSVTLHKSYCKDLEKKISNINGTIKLLQQKCLQMFFFLFPQLSISSAMNFIQVTPFRCYRIFFIQIKFIHFFSFFRIRNKTFLYIIALFASYLSFIFHMQHNCVTTTTSLDFPAFLWYLLASQSGFHSFGDLIKISHYLKLVF